MFIFLAADDDDDDEDDDDDDVPSHLFHGSYGELWPTLNSEPWP